MVAVICNFYKNIDNVTFKFKKKVGIFLNSFSFCNDLTDSESVFNFFTIEIFNQKMLKNSAMYTYMATICYNFFIIFHAIRQTKSTNISRT